jgi:hypothetical protein
MRMIRLAILDAYSRAAEDIEPVVMRMPFVALTPSRLPENAWTSGLPTVLQEFRTLRLIGGRRFAIKFDKTWSRAPPTPFDITREAFEKSHVYFGWFFIKNLNSHWCRTVYAAARLFNQASSL